MLALCQFLPGPASSQLGFAIGLLRAGLAGALAACLAFTLPSALLLFGFACWLPHFTGPLSGAALHGLKLVALVVVTHAVIGMARQLCPDLPRLTLAALAAAAIILTGQAWVQILALGVGGLAGPLCCRAVRPLPGGDHLLRHGPRTGGLLLALFLVLLCGLPVAASHFGGLLAVTDAFFRAGALVFGGGHVVLPLLEESVVKPGWIPADAFLAGYGAAQAVPGPMFSLAAFLGACLPHGLGGLTGASTALIAIFLPGFLLVAATLPLWHTLTSHPTAARAIAGINASVVGLLAAALYHPVSTSALLSPTDAAIALAGLIALTRLHLPPLAIVFWCLASSILKEMVHL